jgi:hypothetical protein
VQGSGGGERWKGLTDSRVDDDGAARLGQGIGWTWRPRRGGSGCEIAVDAR